MGVLGLTPFLQKACPEVLKILPDRLKSLAGSRIVIDGTLITQRLHFVQLPHPYRHVLGWYRLVKELREYDVSAVCVFDGKERNIAKAKEAVRRQEMRKLTSAREIIENDRLERLKNLGGILNAFRSLHKQEKTRVVQLIRESSPKTQIPLFLIHEASVGDGLIPETITLDDQPSDLAFGFADTLGEPASYMSAEVLANEKDLNLLLRPDIDFSPGVFPTDFSLDTHNYSTPAPKPSSLSVSSTPDQNVAQTLIVLYQDFRNSIPKLVSLPTSPSLSSTDDPDTQTQVMMSKGQCQLTLEEGRLWERLREEDQTLSTSVSDDDQSLATTLSVEDALQRLYDKSSYISDSFARRTKPPTAQTYDECREILVALGVPCIEVDGPYEAEALASSLVVHGFADYVASEDTDVVVYDAPLLRNLTNRQGPLMIISGPEIRQSLDLTRERFLDFVLLLGTDFTQRIRNVGPARALKFIKEHGTIEDILKNETKYPPRTDIDDYLEDVALARTVFQTLPPVPLTVTNAERDDWRVQNIMARYKLGREVDWDHASALRGNFFDDNPSSGDEPDATTHGLYV